MKMPRWLVVSLLSASVLAVMGYGAWWWVTWPERTWNRIARTQLFQVDRILSIGQATPTNRNVIDWISCRSEVVVNTQFETRIYEVRLNRFRPIKGWHKGHRGQIITQYSYDLDNSDLWLKVE
jgi:hypothetical protein